MLPVASASANSVAPHLETHPQASERNASSFAPVSMSERPAPAEPTVIVLRERPKAAWFIAAASLGALGAIAATRFLGTPVADHGATAAPTAIVVAASPAPLALAPTNVVLPPVVAAPPVIAPVIASVSASASVTTALPAVAAAPSAVVVHFSEDQGVAIKATPRGPAPARPVAPRGSVPASGGGVAPGNRPAPARAPSMGPALPDGSFSLGRADNAAPVTTPAPSPPISVAAPSTALALAPAPEPPPRRRPLSAEQQLAEAQLKASMK